VSYHHSAVCFVALSPPPIDRPMNLPLVICLGEILQDLLAEQSDRSIAEVTSWKAYTGGAPANVATALVKLGTDTAFIGCVGRENLGKDSIALLTSLGVKTTAVQYHPSAPTRQVYVTRSAAGERYFAGFGAMPTTDFADTRLNADELPESLWENARFLVTGTLGLAYPDSRRAIERALELAHVYGLQVFIDLNWRPVFWPEPDIAPAIVRGLLERSQLLKCSDEEALWLLGTDHPREIARQFPTLRGILVTAGEKGCRYRLGENEGEVKAFPVAVVDTTGAGDGFSAGFLHQYRILGDPIFLSADIARKAVIYASAVGAIVTTGEGAIAPQPSDRQVRDFLEERLRLII
jgi:fructokinase